MSLQPNFDIRLILIYKNFFLNALKKEILLRVICFD
jgi:hypothetical protein